MGFGFGFISHNTAAAGGGAGLTSSFLQQDHITGNGTDTYTFTAENLGVAAAQRFILIGVTWAPGSGTFPTLTSVTIGGVTATILDFTTGTDTLVGNIAWALAAVPSGTTGNVVVKLSSALANSISGGVGIDVFRIVGDLNTTPVAKYNVKSTNDTATTISSSANGLVVFMCTANNSNCVITAPATSDVVRQQFAAGIQRSTSHTVPSTTGTTSLAASFESASGRIICNLGLSLASN